MAQFDEGQNDFVTKYTIYSDMISRETQGLATTTCSYLTIPSYFVHFVDETFNVLFLENCSPKRYDEISYRLFGCVLVCMGFQIFIHSFILFYS